MKLFGVSHENLVKSAHGKGGKKQQLPFWRRCFPSPAISLAGALPLLLRFAYEKFGSGGLKSDDSNIACLEIVAALCAHMGSCSKASCLLLFDDGWMGRWPRTSYTEGVSCTLLEVVGNKFSIESDFVISFVALACAQICCG